MNRHMVLTALNEANRVLASIYASPRAGNGTAALLSADAEAAAALAGVKVEPQAWQADYKAKGRSTKFVDSVNYQRMKP
jgi:hypothetical protein